MNKKKIILFDLDGTLIDSTEAILESFYHTFDLFESPHPEANAIKALIGHPLDVMYASLGVASDKVWDYVAAYKEYYRVISTQKTLLLPHAREAIIEASQFADLGIVTTKTGKYSKVLMEHFGLMHYFKVLIGREDVTAPKPNPEPIFKALEVFGISLQEYEVWMIGDTRMDLEAAQRAGVNGVGVLSGYDTKEQLEPLSDVIFSDVYEAILHLKGGK